MTDQRTVDGVSLEVSRIRGSDPRLPSPIEELSEGRLSALGVRLYLKRDDLIHPDIPGNKWRKLKYNLIAAEDRGHKVLLTFGGAYSNHIRATAAAGYEHGLSTIGAIRGEEHLPLNPTLRFAVDHGMQLTYLDRTTYRNKNRPAVIESMRRQFGDVYLLPEGGSNALAVRGCAELPAEIPFRFDAICCAVGTGGTLAGIAAGLPEGPNALGFAVLKGGDLLVDDVQRLQDTYGKVTTNWSIETGFHFGGFARRKGELDTFIMDFHERHGIVLDWVYEAKMMFGVYSLAQQGQFPHGTVIVAVLAG